MRKPLALLATVAMTLGATLLAPATADAATGPSVKRAWIAKDVGQQGVLDNGDVLKIRFTSRVVVTDPTSLNVSVVGQNGRALRFENECCNYGFYYSVKDTVFTMRVNLIPEEYDPSDPPVLTYPLRLAPVYDGDPVFHNLEGRNGLAIRLSGDLLIN